MPVLSEVCMTNHEASYAILEHYNKIKLEIEVIQFMKEGWTVSGGVSVFVTAGNDICYAQAMVRV